MGRSRKYIYRVVCASVVTILVVSGLARTAVAEGRSYTGTIDGAAYRVEVPPHWNGTLLLYSHGYFPVGFQAFPDISLTNSHQAEAWLLDHGYALAASNFRTVTGFHVDQGYRDQLALLGWFETNVGKPEHVIATGQSMGAAIATRLGERRPDVIDGVATMCAALDPLASYNAGLDMAFAVKTLLASGEDIDLVHARDPEGSTLALQQAVDRAMTTPEGRARLALVASLNNVTGWWSALQPRPADPDERIRQQALWVRNAYIGGFGGPVAFADLEARAGGNPASNVGIDYGQQLARSSQTGMVRDAYRRAHLDLGADLNQLDAAPRISADPAAVTFMHQTSVPTGRLQVPMVTLHSTGDGGAVPDQERWYAQQVRRNSDANLLRHLYVERGQHCSFSGADEVVAIRALVRRVDTGRWPSTDPRQLNAAVERFPLEDQVVVDLSSFPFPTGVMPPAFTRYTPPALLRPSD